MFKNALKLAGAVCAIMLSAVGMADSSPTPVALFKTDSVSSKATATLPSTIAVLPLTVPGTGQVKAQSVEFQFSDSLFSATYLYDGLTNLVGVAYTAKRSLLPNVDVSLVTVTNAQSSAEYYLGTFASYRVPSRVGSPSVSFGFGFKGIDFTKGIDGLKFADKHPFIASLSISIPLKS